MPTEAQKKAKAKYRSKGKSITVEFSPAELELYEYMESKTPKQRYIKDLIRKDMESK